MKLGNAHRTGAPAHSCEISVSAPPRKTGSLWNALFLGSFLLLGACTPKIGDECQISQQCSASGERLCDITMPDGYCTVLGCSAGLCPEDSVCIAFAHHSSPVKGCNDPNGVSRFERTACMATCDEDEDCREGYACIDMRQRNPWGAIVSEDDGVGGKVCVVAPTSIEPDPDHENGVCTGVSSAEG